MIYLAEHGETAVDRAGETHGGRDDPLDRQGREQAVKLGQRLKRMAREKRPAVIYHSDKKRATQTAKIAGNIARIPAVEAPALRPFDAGPLGA
ncbi:MAG: phosphoglycerate mutase family protein, partial [Terriglobales bacterium]